MADAAEAKMQAFLRAHQPQLEAARVPPHLWPIVYYKLQHELFDAGSYFFMARDEDGDMHAVVRDDVDLAPVQPGSDEALFIVDHAWTFTADKMKAQLEQTPPLLERMESLMQLTSRGEDEEPPSTSQRVAGVLERAWKFANTYRIGNLKPEAAAAIWYVMDEFGSAVEHSDTPNMRMAPFFFAEAQCAFSLLWPVEPLEAGDFLARDYVPEQTQDADTRAALLAALFYPPEQNTLVDEQEYMQQLFQAVDRRRQEHSLAGARAKFHAIVSRDSEVLPDAATTKAEPPLAVAISGSNPLQVYSNLTLVYEHLKHPRFEHVESEEGAQVVWPTWHIKDFQQYAANERVQIINQFPNEKILTCKDLLYEMCKLQNGGERPAWLAETYNMASEFPELVAEYIHRDQLAWSEGEKQQDEANHWICKPWNMARSIDTCIAQSAAHLARLTETGPKVACKYIHRPVLIDERKFDLRFLVMVKSTEPLELYLSGVYWLRIANTPFSMDDFQDFEKHFTVMNYSGFGVRIMDNTEFVRRFEDEYPSEDWPRVHAEICASIKQLFAFATANPPPLGLGRCSKSRALYGVDVMLSWETDEESGDESIRPVILEVNFQPDCTRACKYFPRFYDDLMNVLVLGDTDGVVHGVTKL